MKRFYTLCVVLLVLSSLLLSAYAQDNGGGNESPDPATWMPDANLKDSVRTALNLNTDEPLTQEKMLNLKVLNASKRGIMDITGLEYAANLRSLSIWRNEISELTPLVDLIGLTALYIGDNRIRDLSPLANLTNLKQLGMRQNQITDINVLVGLINLEYLRLGGNPITDTSPLVNLLKLNDVDIGISISIPDANLRAAVRAALGIKTSTRITIDAMRDLITLNAAQLGITDLTGLEYATNLRSLSVGGNQISDLTPLAYLTSLRGLYIGQNLISDINPLANLTNLRRLGMLHNQIGDISVLAGLVNLKYLRLGGNPIADTSPLESLPNLSDVDIEIPSLIPDAKLRAAVHAALGIEPNLRITIDAIKDLTTLIATKLGITDLTGLEYATNLTHLYLRQNLISDVNPLAHLTNLKRLEMFRNQVSDISVLSGLVNLEYLRLAGNPITDTSPLRSLPKLTNVDVSISSLPQKEHTQTRGEPTIDPPQDDGGQSQQSQQQPDQNSEQQQQQDDRREDDSDQSQQQQPKTTNPEPTTNSQQQPDQSSEQQQQQPDQNSEQQQSEEGDEDEDKEAEDEKEDEDRAACEADEGTFQDGLCFLPLTTEEWEKIKEKIYGGEAPSHRKNAFILDRITLEQFDPETLEAQLDIWLAESDRSALYLRSIALLENVLATMRPDKTHLLPNYPNPFNPETWIPYHLANPSEVQITIYDTRGTLVRHFDLGHQQEGYYTSRSRAVYWDGCNDIGEKVSSGIYFYQFQTDKTSLLRKMVILK